MISREDAMKIDPMVRGFGKEFIWSPTTSVVDSKALVKDIAKDIEGRGNVTVLRGKKYQRSKATGGTYIVETSDSDILECKFLINAAGQQSLDIAHEYGVGTEFDFFPIKGLYSISDNKLDHIYKTLVYPVPIKGAHFLGVHSTLTVDGRMKIGPTVAPAFANENYHGLQNLKIGETFRILSNYTRMLFTSDQRKLIWTFLTEEVPKLSINRIVKDVS